MSRSPFAAEHEPTPLAEVLDPPPALPSVAAIIDTSILSGPGRQLVAQGVAHLEGGAPFRIITFRRAGRPDSPFVAYAASHGVPCEVIDESGKLDLSVLARTRDVLSRGGVAVVQTHGYRPTSIVRSLRALGWYQGAWVGFYHGATAEDWKVRLYDALDRRLLRAADRVVVMSRPQAALFEALGDGVSLVYNAVLEAGATSAVGGDGSPDAVRDLPTAAAGVLRAAVIGRLSPEKGVDVLLDAMAIVRDRGQAMELLVAGDGPERAALEAQAERLALGTRVRFLGQVHAVAPLYRAVDVVVIPSRSEGLPNVLLEALRHGRFVVSTRVGAVPDVLEGSRAGALVEVEDPAALAAALVAAQSARLSPEAETDRASLIDRFSLAARVRALRSIHQSALRQLHTRAVR